MTFDNWIAAVDKEMMHLYCIDLTDSGFTDKEFFDKYGNQRPVEAVLAFGDDYDLTRRFW